MSLVVAGVQSRMGYANKSAGDTNVELYPDPWVPGTRARKQLGPISSEIFVDDCEPAHAFDWIKAQFEVLERLRDTARVLCANAVVSLEITLDPFACTDDGERSGVRLSAQGTAVTLELVA